jgi:predicted lipoprotein
MQKIIEMKNIYKYIFLSILVAFLGYNSVYFKKLSEIKNQKLSTFDFNAYADSLYYRGILTQSKPIALNALVSQINSNQENTFKTYGNRLGIGNSTFFMVETKGKIVNMEDGKIKLNTAENGVITVDTKYIFGNAIRDASGLVKLTDFKTNADFNKVSEALNTIIREKALPSTIQKLKIGDGILVTGALKLSKKEILSLEILPVQIILQ